MDFIIPYILAYLFSVSSFFILTKSRMKKSITIVSIVVFSILTTIAFYAILSIGGNPLVAGVCAYIIPCYFFYLFISDFKGLKYTFTFCIVDEIGLSIMALFYILQYYFSFNSIIMNLLATITYSCLLYLIFSKRNFYREMLEKLKTGWTGMTILAIAFYIYVVVSIWYPMEVWKRPEYIPVVVLTLLLSACVFFVLILFLKIICKNQELERNQHLMNIQIKLKNSQLRQQEFFQRMAYIDVLTGLKNRAALEEDQMSYQEYWEHFLPMSCMMVDANNLKVTNDRRGHRYGDELLKNIAGLLEQIPLSDKSCYRLGGDEFLVILPNTNEEQGQLYIEELLERIELFNEEREDNVSIAIGIASTGDLNENIRNLIREADTSMYLDKKIQKEKIIKEQVV